MFTKIIRHAFRHDGVQLGLQCFPVALESRDAQPKVVGTVGTTVEFAAVATGLQHRQPFGPIELRIVLARQMQAEPLPGYRVFIFQAAVAHRQAMNAGLLGKQHGHVFGIPAGFFNFQPEVFTLAFRCHVHLFCNVKIVWSSLQYALTHRTTVGAGQALMSHF